MMTRQQKLKAARRNERELKKYAKDATWTAVIYSFLICLYAVKTVFKERASNPKMEQLFLEMLKVWKLLDEKRVSIQTIANSIEMECNLRYDFETDSLYNLKGAEKNGKA